jgi:formiminotetrahydrofolate cyclodeaminase
MAGKNLGELTLVEWLETLAAADPVPGAGSAAALTAACAAALVAMTARLSEEWPEAPGVVAQALALQNRLADLAQADADAYAESLRALAAKGQDSDERRDFALGRVLDRAAQAPLAIAETAHDVALLAASAVDRVRLEVQPDAKAAASLAAAAASAAALLVEVNLTAGENDPRVRQARRAADAAAAAVQSAR